MRPVVNLLRVSGLDIRSQLALEESLLRATQQNWVVVNNGAFRPAIVMGISGYVCVQNRHLLCHAACIYTTLYGPRKFHLHVRVHRRAEELIHVPQARQARMQVLKRFTGGGTVVVDSNTVFASLIFNVS